METDIKTVYVLVVSIKLIGESVNLISTNWWKRKFDLDHDIRNSYECYYDMDTLSFL